MCILQHLPRIKQEYLKQILSDRTLYKEAAIEVKQQIWQDNQPLFGDEVSPILSKYIEEKEAMLYNTDSISQNFFTPSPKTRRQTEVVQNLTQMIGKNVRLYDMVLQFLRTLFLRSRNMHYCTLRAELLMALHDLEIHDICSIDPCHKFTWCLDACIRERFVDAKRARELQGFLDQVRRGQEQVLGWVTWCWLNLWSSIEAVCYCENQSNYTNISWLNIVFKCVTVSQHSEGLMDNEATLVPETLVLIRPLLWCQSINTLMPTQNGRHFPDGTKPLLDPVLTNHQWGLYLMAITKDILKKSAFGSMSLKIANLISQPHLPGTNELTSLVKAATGLSVLIHGSCSPGTCRWSCVTPMLSTLWLCPSSRPYNTLSTLRVCPG